MSVEISNTEITQTFDYWRNRTNELAWAMRKVVLTTDGSLSPSSLVANAVAEGNTRITGTFSANVFSANQNITANTSISVNTAVISPSTTTSFSLINATTISVGNVTENSVLTGSSLSTKGLFIASNVVINTISYFIGDSNSNTVISKESVLHRANTLVNSVSNSTTLRFSNDSVNSTLTFNSLIIGEAAVNSVGVFSGAGVFRANGTSLNANGVIANSSGVYANGLVNAANFTTTGTVNTATVFATGIVNAANFTTTGTVNTATVFATGIVNASSFTTTGSVNTATVFATGLVNAANFTTTGTVNTGTVFATGLVNAANFVTTGTVNTATVFATGIVNASSFTTTGSVNTATVFATGIINASSFTTTGSVNTATVFATGLVNAANFTTTGTVNTATLFATGIVNAANFTTTGTVNTATVFATGLVNAANFTTTGSVNTATVFATGLVNAANFTTTGTVNTSTVFATGIVNASSFTTTGSVNTATVFATGLVNAANFTTTGTVNTGTVYATSLVNATSYNTGNVTTGTGGSVQNTTTVFVGNDVINTFITSAGLNVNGSATIANNTGVYTGIVNATTHSSGAGFTANSTVVNAVSYYAGTTLIGNTTGPYGKTEPNLNVNSALNSNNSAYLNDQLPSYYLNAANFTGTLPWAQSPSGTVNTSGSFTFSGNNTLDGTNTTISSNVHITGAFINVATLVNAAAINIRNQTNTETLYVNSLSTLNGNTVMSGSWANVTGDLRVMGNLTVNGSLTYTGVSAADIVPDSNSFNLGSATKRWTLYSVNIDNAQNVVSNNVIVTNVVNAASFTIGTDSIVNSTGLFHTGVINATSYRVGNVTTGTGGSVQNTTTMLVGNTTINTVITSAGLNVNAATIANSTGVFTGTVNAAIIRTGAIGAETNSVYLDSNFIYVGNSSVNATVNSTVYSKTANNTLFVGSTAAAAVVNSSQLSANLSNYAPLATGANFTGAVSVVNNVTISGNLVVTGTTIYANVNNLDVKDLNITLAKDAPTVASTDGAGITIDVSNIGFYYHRASNTWQSNVGFTPSSNNVYNLGTTDLRWSGIFANNLTLTNSVSAALVSATNVSATDVYGTVKTATQGTIDHNSLANYDANRHIDHTAVSITAGSGLSGGGTIAATRTLSVVAGNSQLISNATGIWANQANFDHNSLANYDANRHIDHTAVSITAGNGLTGGGTIASTRTLTAVGANGISVTSAGINVLAGNSQLISNATGVWANQAAFDHNSLSNYDANRHIDHTAVSITAGNGLTGGGTIASTRTLTAVGANGISITAAGINVLVGNSQLISNATGIWANQAAFDHNLLSNYSSDQHIAHSTVSMTAGNGLTGGGDISQSRTFDIGQGNGISVSADAVAAVGANGISVTSAGINVLANTGIVSNSSGVFANATYIQSLVNVTNGSIVTSGTSAQNVDSFLISSFMGAEYLISVSDNSANNRYVTKTLVMHDGSTAQITEYGSITSNNSVGLFSATQNTTHIVLQFTPSLSATTVKYTRTVV